MVDAFYILLHKAEPNRNYNIGSNEGIRILDLARLLVRLIRNVKPGEEDQFIEYVNGRVVEDWRYKINSDSIKALGWQQKVDFEEGLSKTINWYKENLDFWPDHDFALDIFPN